MKLWRTLCASALAVTVLGCGAAYAAETEEVMVELPEVYFDGTTRLDEFSLFEDATWGEDDTKYREQLSDQGKKLYDGFEELFSEGIPAIDTTGARACITLERAYTGTISPSSYGNNAQAALNAWNEMVKADIYGAMSAFTYDHPEYFWIRTDMGFNSSGFVTNQEMTCSANAKFYLSENCESVEQINAFNQAVNEVVKNLKDAAEGMSSVEKLAFFDNWLAANNVYNTEAANASEGYIKSDVTPWSVIGGLVSKYSPVCEGYAKSLKLLCDKVNIPCIVVTGRANGGDHMWNAVKLDGTWYFCDPTWDDPNYVNGGSAAESRRTYFLTPQPSSHITDASPATPTLSTSGYFTDFAFADSVLSGSEVGTDAHWIALYDDKGMLLDAQLCPSFYWTGGQDRYVAPQFSEEILCGAQTAKRFIFDEKWIPQNPTPVLNSAT